MIDTASRIRQLVYEELAINEDEITLDASFVDDLGADSLDFANLIMGVEEAFGIEIDEDAAERLDTVGKLVRYVEVAQAVRRSA